MEKWERSSEEGVGGREREEGGVGLAVSPAHPCGHKVPKTQRCSPRRTRRSLLRATCCPLEEGGLLLVARGRDKQRRHQHQATGKCIRPATAPATTEKHKLTEPVSANVPW